MLLTQSELESILVRRFYNKEKEFSKKAKAIQGSDNDNLSFPWIEEGAGEIFLNWNASSGFVETFDYSYFGKIYTVRVNK